MKLFFDTCTVIDYLCNRQNANCVEDILRKVEEKEWECYISVGSFYTLTYLIELHLKRNGHTEKEERISKLREMLTNILSTFSVADIFKEDLLSSVNNTDFTDLEDSYQYKAAQNAKCDYLITINIHDFKDANMKDLRVITPQDFLSEIK